MKLCHVISGVGVMAVVGGALGCMLEEFFGSVCTGLIVWRTAQRE